MSTVDLTTVAHTSGNASRWPFPTWTRWVVLAFGGILVLASLRVATGANDLASSGALAAAFGLAVPIALAGLGGLWSERAGVVNIGLEGMMILGTWSAAFFAYHWGPWAGLVGAVLFGLRYSGCINRYGSNEVGFVDHKNIGRSISF